MGGIFLSNRSEAENVTMIISEFDAARKISKKRVIAESAAVFYDENIETARACGSGMPLPGMRSRTEAAKKSALRPLEMCKGTIRRTEGMRIGALEGGGTKMVCAVGDETGRIMEQISIPTTTPEETMPPMIEYFRSRKIEALGIAMFGPVGVTKGSPDYGKVLNTPKLAWRGCDVVGAFEKALGVPVGFDTDVNGSCLGEVTYGAAKGLNSVAYYTIGTGVGGGFYVNGGLLHGMLHPEAGHMLLTVSDKDPNGSVCPFHPNCFEGLCSGPSIEKRWGEKAVRLKDRAEVWELESDYIAQALTGIIMILSPQRIILGGGVMHQEQLFPMIREKVSALVNGYLQTPELADMEHYIVPASLNDDQGIMGAIRLGELAAAEAG